MTRSLPRKGFAEVGTAPASKKGGVFPGRSRWVAVAVGALVVVLMVLGVRSCSPTDTGPVDAGVAAVVPVRASHGPATISDGVPNGYTRDPEGAATAAVNTVQALAEAEGGRIAMTAVEATRIARSASASVRAEVEDGKHPRSNPDAMTILPGAVTVLSFSESGAKVSVWGPAVSQTSVLPGDPLGIRVSWATDTLELVWEDNDWKLRDKSFKVGPDPSDPAVTAPPAGSALASPVQQGYYSFFVN